MRRVQEQLGYPVRRLPDQAQRHGHVQRDSLPVPGQPPSQRPGLHVHQLRRLLLAQSAPPVQHIEGLPQPLRELFPVFPLRLHEPQLPPVDLIVHVELGPGGVFPVEIHLPVLRRLAVLPFLILPVKAQAALVDMRIGPVRQVREKSPPAHVFRVVDHQMPVRVKKCPAVHQAPERAAARRQLLQILPSDHKGLLRCRQRLLPEGEGRDLHPVHHVHRAPGGDMPQLDHPHPYYIFRYLQLPGQLLPDPLVQRSPVLHPLPGQLLSLFLHAP